MKNLKDNKNFINISGMSDNILKIIANGGATSQVEEIINFAKNIDKD